VVTAVDHDLRVTSSLTIPAGELRWRFSRSSGPGGQSVNTTDSRVTVSFDVAGSPCLDEFQRTRLLDRLADDLVDGTLTVTSSRERSQWQNRRVAATLLAERLARALAPPPRPRRPTRPSRASVERRLLDKRMRARTKRDRGATDD